MRRIRRSIESLRSTTIGRAVLVVMLGAVVFSVWNLALRPYPDERCAAPIELVIGGAPEIPEKRMVTRMAPDVEAVREYLDFQRMLGNIPPPPASGEIDYERLRLLQSGRFQREVSVVANGYEMGTARAARDAHQACIHELSTAGFVWRAVSLPAALIAVLAAGRFILGTQPSRRP